MNSFNRRMVISFSVLLCLTLVVSACSEKLETRTLQVGGISYEVEVARTPEERAKGLMHRETLEPQTGMLFVFSRDQKLSFWMKDTKIPLSIAFISRDGVIKEIAHMRPMSKLSVVSMFSVRYALEVNQGELEKLGISVGDRIVIPDDL